jgi:hypothetical protein
VFIWPLILIGYLFYFITGPESSHGYLETLGWIYLITSVLVILTLGVDLERNHAVFWAILFVMFYFLGRWLQDVKGFTLFGDLYTLFANLDVGYSRSFGLATSILLTLPYGLMLIWARLQDKWRITHNEFEHYSYGRADDSLARGAKRVRTTYPDLLEMILLGAGTLIVYSATGRTELRRIHHVPMLPLLRKRIGRILETTAVTTDAMIEEEESDETDTGGEGEVGGVSNERL